MALNEQRDAIVEGVIQRLTPVIADHFERVVADKMADQVAEGLVRGVKLLLKEDRDADGESSTLKSFWGMGYRELLNNASVGTTQWVGRRIVVAAVAAIFVWSMTVLVKYGAFGR